MKMSQEQKYSLDIYESITKLFDEENEDFKYKLTDVDLTKFFTGMAIASSMFYNRITGEAGDLIDFNAILQRLIFQYLINNGKEVKENEK